MHPYQATSINKNIPTNHISYAYEANLVNEGQTNQYQCVQHNTSSVLFSPADVYSAANVCFVSSKSEFMMQTIRPKFHCVPWKESLSSVWRFLKNSDPDRAGSSRSVIGKHLDRWMTAKSHKPTDMTISSRLLSVSHFIMS